MAPLPVLPKLLPAQYILLLLLSFFFPALAVSTSGLAARPTDQSNESSRAEATAGTFAAEGLEYFYSAEFQLAEASYKKAVELEPEDPLYWAGLGDSYLFQILLKAGRLDSQLYGESNEFLQVKPPAPDPALVKAMNETLARARSIAEKQLSANPNNIGAHYALGIAYALEANYDFSIARRYWDALRVSRRAKDEEERVRQLDPSNHDANLIIGTYEYAVGSVPAAFRWVLYLAGYSGSKKLGLELLQDTIKNGKRNAPAAVTILALFYAREKKYAESRQLFEKTLGQFPRNYLAEMEIGFMCERERNVDAAIQTYQDVAHKTETHRPGFEQVPADRLYFQIASLLEHQNRNDEALAYYQRVLSLESGTGRLQAETEVHMGDIYRAQNQPAIARQMYERARELPFPDIQRRAAGRLRSMPR